MRLALTLSLVFALMAMLIVGCGESGPQWVDGGWVAEGDAEALPTNLCLIKFRCEPITGTPAASLPRDRRFHRETKAMVGPAQPDRCTVKWPTSHCAYCFDRIDSCDEPGLAADVREQNCCAKRTSDRSTFM